ncbi:MAG: flagellar biosynthesis protein FlhB [Hydrogenothermaceae bacterium]|nr:flagellar biosynthesis protein FlhB [Hydrogenothermaceae bacterium]
MAKDPSKTEKATPRRRQKAREEGQVLRSQDIPISATLTAIFLAFLFYLPYAYKVLMEYFKYTFSDPIYLLSSTNSGFIYYTGKVIGMLLLPILILLLVVGVVSNVAQFGFLFTMKPLTPKIDKLNPFSGIRRMFSLTTAFELIRNLLKLTIAVVVSYFVVSYLMSGFLSFATSSLSDQIKILIKTIMILIFAFAILSIPIAVIDFFYRRHEYEENLKMTKHEVKEEMKSYEGNPLIKKEIRKKMRMLALRRMIKEVPKADVVITNPEHFAVALKYERGKMDAPKVIAKGQDLIAQKIKEVAKENGVKIVEDPPLARGLYESCEVGDYIPEKFYIAVAKILAEIYKSKKVKV